jgi:hypothetical protein
MLEIPGVPDNIRTLTERANRQWETDPGEIPHNLSQPNGVYETQ